MISERLRGARANSESGPGVPEAEGRALVVLVAEVGMERIHRIWRFPPLRKGRRERGLLAAGVYTDDPERHLLVTLSWRAEETGKGISFETRYEADGEAPPDRLPRIIAGVLRRTEEALAVSTLVEVAGDAEVLHSLAEDMGVRLPAVATPAVAQPHAATPTPERPIFSPASQEAS